MSRTGNPGEFKPSGVVRVVSYRSSASPTPAPQKSAFPDRLSSVSAVPSRRRSRRLPARTWDPAIGESGVVTPERLTLVLPLPPSINHQYATLNGRRILSAEGRLFKQSVTREVLVALARSPHRTGFRRAAQTAPLSLSIHFYFVTALRRDVDGGLKIAQDALCEALEINDNRIHEIHLFKDQDALRPRIELTLLPLPGRSLAP